MPTFFCSAILFDLDGVLLDSTHVVAEQYARWARERGLDPAEVMKAAHGVRTMEVVRRVAPLLDAEAETRKIEEREAAADGIVAIPGAVALVNSIPRGRWGVVTSGTRFLATTRMRKFGIPVPEVLVTADDVKNGKPDPEPYRLGAELLQVDPLTCLVVEVISLPTTYPREELREAEVVASGLPEIQVSLNGTDGRDGLTVSVAGRSAAQKRSNF